MKTILHILLPLILGLNANLIKPIDDEKCETQVFICNSTRSNTYHYKENCSGIIKCKDTIRRICKHKAINFGRVQCKLEKTK